MYTFNLIILAYILYFIVHLYIQKSYTQNDTQIVVTFFVFRMNATRDTKTHASGMSWWVFVLLHHVVQESAAIGNNCRKYNWNVRIGFSQSILVSCLFSSHRHFNAPHKALKTCVSMNLIRGVLKIVRSVSVESSEHY